MAIGLDCLKLISLPFQVPQQQSSDFGSSDTFATTFYQSKRQRLFERLNPATDRGRFNAEILNGGSYGTFGANAHKGKGLLVVEI